MIVNRVFPKRIGPSTLTASAVTYLTADKRYGIERFVFTNYSSADATVILYLVPTGQSIGNSYKLLGESIIPMNDTSVIQIPTFLDVGDKIMALASATSSINMTFNINETEIGML